MLKRKDNFKNFKNQINDNKVNVKDGIFTFFGPITVSDFAKHLNISATKIISFFFKKGQMFTINQFLNEDQIAEFCLEIGLDFEKREKINVSNFMEQIKMIDDKNDLVTRPPIITIMGHVNHGKTTLLDYIRSTKLVDKESGGITQHIGAYQVKYNNKFITFLDTPGHESFTAMRARGSKITDIVILVVAADDGVKMQTKEAIEHALAAKVPIIVFVNKMDKQDIDLKKLQSELSNLNIISEEWGGESPFVYGSAKTGDGIDKLLETILLLAEVKDLKANVNCYAQGYVIESHVDKGLGPVATLIIKNGTLIKSDFIVAGHHYGNVRKMINSFKKEINIAKPSEPVFISGLNFAPEPGEMFISSKNEKEAKKLAEDKKFNNRIFELSKQSIVETNDGQKNLNIILKADFKGSIEALKHSLNKIVNEETKINIISQSVGPINNNDINLASASNAIIIAFNINSNFQIKKLAQDLKIKILSSNIIYVILEEIEKILKNMESPKYKEIVIGEAQILKIFFSSKVGNIAGCKVISGLVKSNSKINLYRNSQVIFQSWIDSLQKEKSNVKEVKNGHEFGCHIKNYDDIQEGDIIQFLGEVRIN